MRPGTTRGIVMRACVGGLEARSGYAKKGAPFIFLLLLVKFRYGWRVKLGEGGDWVVRKLYVVYGGRKWQP